MLLLVLLPSKVDAIMQEKCCKTDAVGAFGFGSRKMVLILLAEVIAFYIELITIDIR